MAGGIPATNLASWHGENWSAIQGDSNAFVRATIAFDDGGGPAISVKGALPAAGGTRFYPSVYRNAVPFCTAATTNRTNGIENVWGP